MTSTAFGAGGEQRNPRANLALPGRERGNVAPTHLAVRPRSAAARTCGSSNAAPAPTAPPRAEASRRSRGRHRNSPRKADRLAARRHDVQRPRLDALHASPSRAAPSCRARPERRESGASPHVLSRGNASRSTSATRCPARASAHAAAAPAGPAPMTSTSWMDGAAHGPLSYRGNDNKAKGRCHRKERRPGAQAQVPAARLSRREHARNAGSGLAPGMQTINSLPRGGQRRRVDGVSRARLRLRARGRPARYRRPAALRRDAPRRVGGDAGSQGRRTAATGGAPGALHLRGRRGPRDRGSARGGRRRRATPRTSRGATGSAIVTDPDGYRWALATFKKLAPFCQQWAVRSRQSAWQRAEAWTAGAGCEDCRRDGEDFGFVGASVHCLRRQPLPTAYR